MLNEIEEEEGAPRGRSRPRLLLVAYSLALSGTMEERNGWQRAILATRYFDVTVVYLPTSPTSNLVASIPLSVPKGALEFFPVEDNWFCKYLKRHDLAVYLTYRIWHWRAYQAAKKLHGAKRFAASHLVTICGFREPGYVWKLGIPHVWGPLGGTHNFPKQFLRSLNFWNKLREIIRSAVNYYQLNWSRRVRRGFLQSHAVVAATMEAREALEKGFGRIMEVELETGLDYSVPFNRHARDPKLPLRVLWAGRLREWKGLPILLHAVADLPEGVSVQVRVLGSGSSKVHWMKLASKLCIADKVEWIPWTSYKESLQHYNWAEIFAFTSLRDTSGTGLLESLAAGCPILGLNHQGAKDIMTSDCAIPISANDWQAAVSGFKEGLTLMTRDVDEWQRLSVGAYSRSKKFIWATRLGSIEHIYQNLQKQILVSDRTNLT